MNNTAYYDALGVGTDATEAEIKRAYRKLARKYHPDVSDAEDAEDRFKEMKEAYDCLKGSDSRAAYDSYGEHWKAAMEAGVEPGQSTPGHDGAPFGTDGRSRRGYDSGRGFDFGDIFGDVFTEQGDPAFRRSYQTYSSRGEDVQARMQISVEDSFGGASKQIEIQVLETDADGRPQSTRRKLDVKIPKGITEGQRIRLRGQGHAGFQGGENGDLYVQIAFTPHPLFDVRGRDVHSKLPVSPWQAALGASVQVKTLGGFVEAKVPPATSSGKVMRLNQRGLPGLTPGDHFVEIVIDMAGTNSGRAKALFEELRNLETSENSQTT